MLSTLSFLIMSKVVEFLKMILGASWVTMSLLFTLFNLTDLRCIVDFKFSVRLFMIWEFVGSRVVGNELDVDIWSGA